MHPTPTTRELSLVVIHCLDRSSLPGTWSSTLRPWNFMVWSTVWRASTILPRRGRGKKMLPLFPPVKGFSTGTGKKDWPGMIFRVNSENFQGFQAVCGQIFLKTQNVSEIGWMDRPRRTGVFFKALVLTPMPSIQGFDLGILPGRDVGAHSWEMHLGLTKPRFFFFSFLVWWLSCGKNDVRWSPRMSDEAPEWSSWNKGPLVGSCPIILSGSQAE